MVLPAHLLAFLLTGSVTDRETITQIREGRKRGSLFYLGWFSIHTPQGLPGSKERPKTQDNGNANRAKCPLQNASRQNLFIQDIRWNLLMTRYLNSYSLKTGNIHFRRQALQGIRMRFRARFLFSEILLARRFCFGQALSTFLICIVSHIVIVLFPKKGDIPPHQYSKAKT